MSNILEEAIERYRDRKTTPKSTVTVNGTSVAEIVALRDRAAKKIARAKAFTKENRRRIAKAKRKSVRTGRPKRATRSIWTSTAIHGHKVSGGLPSLGKRR